MRRLKEIGTLVCVVAMVPWMLSGCATVFRGAHTDVNLTSDPSGAEVYVNGERMGTTPIELELESKKVYHVEFKMDGFEAKTYTITNHVGAGWVVLDVLFGVVPVVVDWITGSWYYLDEENLNIILLEQQ
jgi:hypothetical protein